MPTSGRGAGAIKDELIVVVDLNGSGIETDTTTSIAQLTHGQERRGDEGRDDVDVSSGWEMGKVQLCFVGGVHDGSVGIGDADGRGRWTFVHKQRVQ